MSFIIYCLAFFLNREFRENLAWVKWTMKKLAIIPANGWTSFRFLAPLIPILDANPYSKLALYIALFFTDAIDGAVARFRNKRRSIFGPILDGAADLTLVATAFLDSVSAFVSQDIVWAMILTDAAVCLFPFFLKSFLAFKKGRDLKSIFSGKEGEEFTSHKGAGKIKVVLQASLFVFCQIGTIAKANAEFWSLTATLAIFPIIGFSILSAVQRLSGLKLPSFKK